jgi:hypothetical protein
MKGSINFDDAATPGAKANSRFLHDSRKSWAAVIIPSEIADDVQQAMEIFTGGIMGDYGASELHFTDIYSGRNEFKGVAVEKRIEIFELMTALFENFELPVLYQTCSKEILKEWGYPRFKKRVWWKSNDPSKMGLLYLCHLVSKLFEEHHEVFRNPLQAFVDEGMAKVGTKVKLPNWGHAFQRRELCFASSKTVFGLQLADFAAFSISHSQWLLANAKKDKTLKEGDLFFLKNASRIWALNLKRVEIDADDISSSRYEFDLGIDRLSKGLPFSPPTIQSKD